MAKTAATGEVPGASDADENRVVNWWIRSVLRRLMVEWLVKLVKWLVICLFQWLIIGGYWQSIMVVFPGLVIESIARKTSVGNTGFKDCPVLGSCTCSRQPFRRDGERDGER